MNGRLLRTLRAARDRHIPLASLGDDLAGLQRDLDELTAFGFAIERHPVLGVCYRGPSARLCPDQIEEDLDTLRVGRRLAVWNRVTSTNDLAARAAASQANDGLVILAEEQTFGRGRRGSAWSAPAQSSLLMSVVFGQGLDPADDLVRLTALGAVAVAELVAAWTRVDARIKWPNDVRVEGRKIAGILVERPAGSVVGIGVNINIARDEFPSELRDSATSVQILAGAPVDRSEFCRELIQRVDRLCQDPAELEAAWNSRSEHVGRSVRVETHAGILTGVLRRLDFRDGLILEAPTGEERRLGPAQVVRLGPPPSE
ncbi:MAG: biotin--[acetyl-CoA-carboxylase] ligase [Isosphaeraceae bacterium]